MSIRENAPSAKAGFRNALYVLFAFSGFPGLVYESIWAQYLKLFLGSAAYAQTLVLVIFMGGMAVGAWGVGRLSSKIGYLLLAYALVEGVIGVMALVFHAVFVSVTDFSYATAIPAIGSPTLLMLYKWGAAALLILPQTILLGATFPLMSGGVIRASPTTPGRTLAVLYFANSIGAVVGVLVSGFVLVGRFGLPGAMLTAGIVNLVIAPLVWLIWLGAGGGLPPAVPDQRKPGQGAAGRGVLVGFLMCACLTGTASFMYEIGWIRMLCLVLGSSTHAFELMLSAFILGLALGGYWIRKSIDTLADPVGVLGVVQVVMACLALGTVVFYDQAFDVMSYILAALAKSTEGYLFFNVLSHGLAMLVMLPATVCAGMTLPLITFHLLAKGYGEGVIGKTYAANTAGAIVGVLLGVHVVMPLLGVRNVIVVGAGIDALLGLALLWHGRQRFGKAGWALAAVFSGGFLLVCALWVRFDTGRMASCVYHTGVSRTAGNVVFHKDGKTASVDLIHFPVANEMSISTNGKPDASVGLEKSISRDEPTQVLLGALGLLVHDKVKSAAVVGIGSGMTSHVMLTVPGLESLDIVEIEPAMVEGARQMGERVAKAFSDPRAHIRIEDAKTFFTNQRRRYDLIVSEPSNPWVSGVSGLFTREFHRLARRHLAEDGVLVQWIQLYDIGTPLVASIMKITTSARRIAW